MCAGHKLRHIIIDRYDTEQGDCIATASEDSTVRLWNTGNGQMLKSFRGSSSNVVLDLDLCGTLIAACGTDKMCRIWNTRTERLVRQKNVIFI